MLADIRYAIRVLLKNPAFSLVAVLTLALGIGANTAIFSVVNAVLLRPLSFGDPDRLVEVWTSTAGSSRGGHSAADFLDIARENRSLTEIAGHRTAVFSASAGRGDPLQFQGSYVTANFFDVLRIAPAIGRLFTQVADASAGGRLVVLSDGAWRQLFGEDRGVAGRTIAINGESHTVVGVLPPRAEWPERARVWILSAGRVPPSLMDISDPAADREVRYFDAIARLQPGMSVPQAQDDLIRVNTVLRQRRAPSSEGYELRVGRLYDELVGDIRPGLLILQAAVGLVLLVACANVSSLLIARATGRRRELAIRAALGASRARLLRESLIESLVIGVAGGLAGLLVGSWIVVLLVKVLPAGIPRTDGIGLDLVVALMTMAAAGATGVLFGMLPALQASRAEAGAALKASGGRTSSARARGRAVLVVAEVALTLVLLVGAGLLLNSFLRLQRVDSGFRPEHVTVMGLMVPQSRYPSGEAQTALYARIVEGLANRPEVRAVGVGFPGPLRGSNASGSFFIEGRAATSRDDRAFAHMGSVSGGYFSAVGMPLLAGRTFSERDRKDAPAVAIASAALARKYWPGENAVGKRLRFDQDPGEPWMTVVGVVGDARQLGLDQEPPPVLYIPYEQFPLPFTNLAVRSTANEQAMAALIRAQVTAVDPALQAGEVATLQTLLDRSVAEPRFRTLLIAAFALVAVVLAAVGVYGLISYSVTERTREIGIRVALGARPRQVMGPVVREGLALALVGVGIGLAGAVAAAQVLARFLFGVAATDPPTFIGVALLLLLVAAAASYIPARRVLRVDPIVALRVE
jgi:putative ABC transport system permease protein